MSNNFSTIKLNQSSEKFNLVRISPKRYVNDDLSSIGGGQYEMTFTFPVSRVLANSVALTKVTSVVNPSEYSWDGSTLTIYSTPSASNIIVVEYHLFYTSGKYRVIGEDPETPTVDLRDWLPRITQEPVVSVAVDEIINGKLSFNSSSISIINNENEFNAYLTDNDSFNNADIKIWLCLDDISNIQKIFEGTVSEVSPNKTIVSFRVDDPLSLLNTPAYMGDTAGEAYNENIPIPYIIGNASRYETVAESVTTLTEAQKLDHESLYVAQIQNYSNDISNTTNRDHVVCRASSDGFLDFSFTPSNIDQSNVNYTRIDGTFAQIDKVRIGDTFIVNQSSTDYYVRVYYVDRINNYIYTTKEAGFTTGATVETNDCPSLVLFAGGTSYYLLYGRDFTASTSATSYGNTLLEISLASNFEANHGGLPDYNPREHQLKYRVRPNITNASHANTTKAILESSGLTVNAASFTQADVDLTANCNFSIPTFDEADYGTCIKYIEQIVSSTIGFIALNNSFEIEYNIFTAPSSTDEITNADILKDSYSVEIDYKDIITEIIAYNPHYSSDEAKYDTSKTPSYSAQDLKAKHLHGVEKAVRLVHVLDRANDIVDTGLGIRSNRRMNIIFDTKLINVDSEIGDDILLVRDDLPANEASKQLKIISLNKGNKRTKIIATDLLGI